MKIEIDTSTMTEADATALVEMMASLYPVMAVNRMVAGGVSEKDGNVAPPPMDVRDDDDEPREAGEPVDAASDVDLKDVPRDAAGISWDARIHTSNQATKQDGTWKRKPGLDDAFYCGVMVELTETAVLPEPEAPYTARETALRTTQPPALPEPEAIETNAETAFAPPPPPPPPASEGEPAPDTFLSNVELATTLRIGGGQLRAALAEAGLEGMAALASADEETQSKVAGLLRAAGAAQ